MIELEVNKAYPMQGYNGNQVDKHYMPPTHAKIK